MSLLVSHAARSAGSTYYVAVNGDDAHPGTLEQPFRTLNAGARMLQPGDTLIVRGGVYDEALENAIPSGESWDRPVTVRAYSGERPMLAPRNTRRVIFFSRPQHAYIVIDGFILDGAGVGYEVVKITGGAHHIRIENSELRNAPSQGVLINGGDSTHNELINLDIHHNGVVGVRDDHVHGVYLQTGYNLVRGSRLWANGGQGVQIRRQHGHEPPIGNVVEGTTITDQLRCIIVFDGVDTTLSNNVLSGCDVGIHLNYDTAYTRIWNNTITRNANGIVLSPRAYMTTLTNNIIVDNTEFGVRARQPQTLAAMEHNHISGSAVNFDGDGIIPAQSNRIGEGYGYE